MSPSVLPQFGTPAELLRALQLDLPRCLEQTITVETFFGRLSDADVEASFGATGASDLARQEAEPRPAGLYGIWGLCCEWKALSFGLALGSYPGVVIRMTPLLQALMMTTANPAVVGQLSKPVHRGADEELSAFGSCWTSQTLLRHLGSDRDTAPLYGGF